MERSLTQLKRNAPSGAVVGRRQLRVTAVAAPPTPSRSPSSTGAVSKLCSCARMRAPAAAADPCQLDRAVHT